MYVPSFRTDVARRLLTCCHRIMSEQILKCDNKLVLQMMEAQKDEKLKLKRRQLNHLLGFTCVRLKERVGTV
jgi:hypothetical protein